MTSTHKTEVVPVVLTPHPNADSLSIVKVWAYDVCVRTEEWLGKDRGAFIVPDSIFEGERVKAKKLRGVVSQGMLVPAPEGSQIGDDVSEALGVTRYEPKVKGDPGLPNDDPTFPSGEEEDGPNIDTGPLKYDIENWYRYPQVFEEGEPVVIHEKVDGMNCRAVWHDGRLWVKSRNRWVKRTADYSHITVEMLVSRGMDPEKAEERVRRLPTHPPVNTLWKALEEAGETVVTLAANPGYALFGEVYGNTARLKYGANKFIAFDWWAVRLGEFFPQDFWDSSFSAQSVPKVPELYRGPYSEEKVKELSQGQSLINPAIIREGCVVRPLVERWHPKIGRVILKCVNPAFLEK